MSSITTTSTFLDFLRQHASLPLVFRAQGESIPPGYHLTEVKRVSYETMDCGAMTHRWAETQFEIWVPPLNALTPGRGHLQAGKFLQIIDRVERELPLAGATAARIHASFAGQPAALYDIGALEVHQGQIQVELVPDRTRCKAAERRVAQVTGGCCGSDEEAASSPAGACCAPAAAASETKSTSSCCV